MGSLWIYRDRSTPGQPRTAAAFGAWVRLPDTLGGPFLASPSVEDVGMDLAIHLPGDELEVAKSREGADHAWPAWEVEAELLVPWFDRYRGVSSR